MDKKWKNGLLLYTGLPLVVLYFAFRSSLGIFELLSEEALLIFGYLSAVSDLKSKKIPNRLVLTMLVFWLLLTALYLVSDGEKGMEMLRSGGLGFLMGGGLFLAVYFISRKGLGGGDVKFMAVAGLYLGFERVLAVTLVGSVATSLVGLVLILLKKMDKKDPLPMAPFLYIGILLSVLLR